MVNLDTPPGSALWRAALTKAEPHPTFSPLGSPSLTPTPRDPRHCWASASTAEQSGVGMSGRQDMWDNPREIPAYRTWLLWRLLWQRLLDLLGDRE